jgi:hypothetical protein
MNVQNVSCNLVPKTDGTHSDTRGILYRDEKRDLIQIDDLQRVNLLVYGALDHFRDNTTAETAGSV